MWLDLNTPKPAVEQATFAAINNCKLIDGLCHPVQEEVAG